MRARVLWLLLLMMGFSVYAEGDGHASRAIDFLKASGVSDEVIQRMRDALGLSLPAEPSPEYRSFLEEQLYLTASQGGFPALSAFRAKVAERLSAIERNPKPAFDGWNTMDQPLLELENEYIVNRMKWNRDFDHENSARQYMQKYHPDQPLWDMSGGGSSSPSETHALAIRNLQAGVRRIAQEADLLAAAADAHNAIVRSEIQRTFRRIGEIIGEWERARNAERVRASGMKPSAFDDLVSQINAATKYTVHPHSKQSWSYAHHRPFSRLEPDETAEAYQRRLTRDYVMRIQYVANWPSPDWSELHKVLLTLRMEFAGLYSVFDVEGPVKASIRRAFQEAARQSDIRAMIRLHGLQENMAIPAIGMKELQAEITAIVLKDYEAAVSGEDIAGMMKVYAFSMTGLADPSKIPPLGKDPNLDRIVLKSYRAAVDRRDADGIMRALAFSQSGFVSPEAALKSPDAPLTEMAGTWYDAARGMRDAAGMLRAYGYVERGFAGPFVDAAGLARDLKAISGVEEASRELDRAAALSDPALQKTREEIEAARSAGMQAEERVEEMIRDAGENASSGISDALNEVADRERSFDEDLAFHDGVMSRVRPLMDRLPEAVAAHGAAAYSRYWENTGSAGRDESLKIYAERARANAEAEARRILANYTRLVANIEAPAATVREVKAASARAKASIAAVPQVAHSLRSASASSAGMHAEEIRLPAWRATADFSAVRKALASSGQGASGPSVTPGLANGHPEIEEVKEILQRLFVAYEQENSGEFRNALADNFAGSDLSFHSYDASRFTQAMQDDFRNLDRIEFKVNVTRPVQYLPEVGRVRAEFTWRRRAFLERSGQEWLLNGRRSTLIFSRSSLPGSSARSMKLVSIEGDPIFGIAEPSGIIVLREGSLDGNRITTPIVLSGGETKSTNPAAVAPTASATATPTSGPAPHAVTFTGSGQDQDGVIIAYHWDFGDGSTSLSQNPLHTYTANGTYIAILTVTDNDGAIGQTSLTITVAGNLPPVPGISANVTSGAAPLTVNFTSTSSDPDGTIVSTLWDFGDSITSTLAHPSYTYTVAGSFTVYLTVQDNSGDVRTTTQAISVTSSDLHVSGTILSNATWSGNVFIDGSVTIPSGVTVTVSPGTTVTFTGNYAIFVQGTLSASSGTFQGQTSSAGFWNGIRFMAGSTCDMTGNTIQHGGNLGALAAAVTFDAGVTVTGFSSNTLTTNTTCLKHNDGTYTYTNNILQNSTYGVQVGGGSPTISGGTISGHTGRGIYAVSGTVIGAIGVTGAAFSSNASHIDDLGRGGSTAGSWNITSNTFSSTTGGDGISCTLLTDATTVSGNSFSGSFGNRAIRLFAPGSVTNNTINITGLGGFFTAAIDLSFNGGAPVVSGNTVSAPLTSLGQALIMVDGAGSVTISGNTLGSGGSGNGMIIGSVSATINGVNSISNCRRGIGFTTGFAGTATISSNNITNNSDVAVRGWLGSGGTINLDDNYLAGNAGAAAGTVEMDTTVPTSASIIPQYGDVSSVTNPSATAN